MTLALYSVVGDATAGGTGTEVTGGSYARKTITFGAAVTTTGVAASSNAQTYTNMPAITTTSVALLDSNGTPRRAWWGTLTGGSKVTALGDTLSFAIGAVTVTLT
jgi:hypothetical protein